MNTSLRAQKLLPLMENIVENGRFWQSFEIFLIAGNTAKKSEDVKMAIILSCIGKEAVDVFNTFDLNDDERKNMSDVLNAIKVYAIIRKNMVIERCKFNCRPKRKVRRFPYRSEKASQTVWIWN